MELETHDDYFQAELVTGIEGATRIGFSLPVEPSESCACKFATAVLLLRTCRAVRGVRATWNSCEQNDPYRFESAWAELPTPSDLNHALAGLSLAARLCSAETQALQQESIANSFLVLQGRSLKEISAIASTE